MGAGAGGMAIASEYMKQLDKRILRRVQETRDRIRARHILRRLPSECPTPDDFKFPCYHLCGNCGYMEYQPGGPCPVCNKNAWVNLQSKTVAYDLHDLEQDDRQRTFFTGKKLIFIFGVYEAILFLILVGMRIPDFPQKVGAILFALMLLPLLIYVLRRPITWAVLWMEKKKAIIRWRMPVREISDKVKPTDSFVGKAKGETPIPSLLGLAPCLAYQVAVRFDAIGDARPPQWILEEADNCAFESIPAVGQPFSIPAYFIMLTSKLLPVEAETLEANHVDLNDFLHQRGLFLEDGEYEFFYAEILPGDQIETTVYPDKTIAVKVLNEHSGNP